MTTLLSSKQLQELLNIDRTTVYRMLKDGRLNGIKVGNQWRFSKEEVDALLAGGKQRRAAAPTIDLELIPLNCIQAMQDVFAEMVGVGAMTTTPDGTPLTKISNSCRFCDLIMSSPSGRQACINSWRTLNHQPAQQFSTCHAGLKYAGSPIEINNKLRALFVVGQFYTETPDPEEEARRVAELADKHNLDVEALQAALKTIPLLGQNKQANVWNWLAKEVELLQEIGQERLALMEKLEDVVTVNKLGIGARQKPTRH